MRVPILSVAEERYEAPLSIHADIISLPQITSN